MRIRRDAVFISSVLLTLALLCLVPASVKEVLAGHDQEAIEALDPGYRVAAKTMGDLGVASVTIILIGLIVVWSGYDKKLRWTWFVMFIIVWVWAFPFLALPFFKYRLMMTLAEWVSHAIRESGPPRDWAECVLIFMLMVVALLLPIKAFFWRPKGGDK